MLNAQSRTDNNNVETSRYISTAVLFIFIGLSMVWLAGFSNAEILHAAAHDARHSMVFPCH
ncbi:MAG: CbtB-domain containing protein [Alphaproteobacteria bacterium]|nr:CbtB-domain containing protein [Alphaproteobacteria bacterium]